MTKVDYFGIINSFSKYISSIYYSPPLEEFSSRDSLMNAYFFNPNALQEEKEILKLAKSKGIKTELAINFEKDLDLDFLELVLKETKKFNEPDIIVTYNNYIETCIKIFGRNKKYVLSYNESICSLKDLELIDSRFDYIVQGNRWLRSIDFYNKCKELGFETKLLLNNGCSHNCTWCVTPEHLINKELNCDELLDFNIKKNNVNFQIAKQTILPYELNYIEKYFDHYDYKISNRPCYYYELKVMLLTYINREKEDIALLNKTEYYKRVYFNCMTRLFYWKKYYSECNWMKVWDYKNKLYLKIGEVR